MPPKNPVRVEALVCTGKFLYLHFQHDCFWILSLCPHWDTFAIFMLQRPEANHRRETNSAPLGRGTVSLVSIEIWKDRFGLEVNLFRATISLVGSLTSAELGCTQKGGYSCQCSLLPNCVMPLVLSNFIGTCGCRRRMPWMVIQKKTYRARSDCCSSAVNSTFALEGITRRCANSSLQAEAHFHSVTFQSQKSGCEMPVLLNTFTTKQSRWENCCPCVSGEEL